MFREENSINLKVEAVVSSETLEYIFQYTLCDPGRTSITELNIRWTDHVVHMKNIVIYPGFMACMTNNNGFWKG
jgi:hypothetical protein